MSQSNGPRVLFRGSIIFHGSMALISAIGISLLYSLPEYFRSIDKIAIGFSIGFGFGLIASFLSFLLSKAWSQARILEERLAQIFEGLTVSEIFILALLSSFAEELLFRGLLQPFLGLWITSILFGIAHWTGDRRLLAWPLLSILAGYLLGELSLWQPAGLSGAIGAHFAINWIGLSRLRQITKLPHCRFSEAD